MGKSEHVKAVESGAADELLRLDNQLCFALYAATNRVTRLYQPLLAELGLTYPQYLVMLVLWEQGTRSVGELGRALDLDTGTLTPLLKRMEAAGLVQRRRDADDERRVLVSLTPVGTRLRERARDIPGALMCQVDFALQDIMTLRSQLRGLLQALGKS